MLEHIFGNLHYAENKNNTVKKFTSIFLIDCQILTYSMVSFLNYELLIKLSVDLFTSGKDAEHNFFPARWIHSELETNRSGRR